MEVGNRIEIQDEYKSKGSLNLAYVSEAKGTVATYILSYIIPDWKRVKVSAYTYDKDESMEDVSFRSNIDLLTANNNAIKNAYLKANKSYQVLKTEFYIYYVDNNNKNDLKVGDKILKVNNEIIENLDSVKNILQKYNDNDKVNVLIERDNKEKLISAKLYKKDNELVLGIYLTQINSYKTYPKVKIKFKKSESGPSGGIIETLDIYNKLVKEDITNGLKIAGTGEIDSEGNVLPIGEVKYKLLGAVKDDADIFIVPNGDNYKECKKIKEAKNLKIKLIKVKTFDEALTKLKKIQK